MTDDPSDASYFDAATLDYNNYINSGGTPSVRLEPKAAGHRSDIFIYPTNTYLPGTTNLLPQTIGFWGSGSLLSSADYAYLEIGSGEASMTITSASAKWKYYSYNIPASQSGQRVRLTLISGDAKSGMYFDTDSWEYAPVYLPTVIATNSTNFFITPIGNSQMRVIWNQLVFTNRMLYVSTDLSNWSIVTNSTLVSNGFVTLTLPIDQSAASKYYGIH